MVFTAPENTVKEYFGGCHCKRFRYKFSHPAFDNGEHDVGNCNCSICTMSGLLFIYTPEKLFEFTSGTLDGLTCYEWYKKHFAHYFCPTCGTEIFNKTRDLVGVNVRTVDGVEIERLKLKPFDGANLL